MGRTTAEILEQLLDRRNWNKPIDLTNPTSRQKLIFRQQFRDIWEKLRDAGIPMRPVFWSKEDKKKYDAEHYDPYKYARTWLEEYDKGEQSNPPDCNDCIYLNFTEKEQQVYGINSYKKDHRCKCYDRPVYHGTNSTKHDPYIYPCEECYKDNFVNYYI